MTESASVECLEERIHQALQRVYGELTYEPGERPHLLKKYFSDEAIDRLQQLIVTVHRIYPVPRLLSTPVPIGGLTSLCELSEELDKADLAFRRMQHEARQGLCHSEDSRCSLSCAESAEFYGRILHCRSSLLEISAAVELIKLKYLRGIRASLEPLRVA